MALLQSSTPSVCVSSRQASCPSRTEDNHCMCRMNVLHQRAVRLSLLHWQHAALAKVFQRWKEYKGRRAQLFGSLIALACKWEQPLMEDAWAAWREYAVESKRIKVKDLESGNAWLAVIVMRSCMALTSVHNASQQSPSCTKWLEQVTAAGNHAELNSPS